MIKTIAIDFDGVIHKYSKGWHDGTIYDEPFKGVFDCLSKLTDDYNVFIFSTRSPKQIYKWMKYHCYDCGNPDEAMSCYWRFGFSIEKIPFWTKFWNKRHVIGITRCKLPAHIYIDDRAYKHVNWHDTMKKLALKK